MHRWFLLGALVVTTACDSEGGGIFGGGGGGGGGGTVGKDDIPSTAELMRTDEADLSDGAPEADLGWLESRACVPGTQFEKFDGNWVWFTYEQPAQKQVYVEADPESGVDVSLIVSQAEAGSSGEGSEAVTGLCEAGLDYDGKNAGTSEAVKVTSVNLGYHLIIGVAGAFEEDSGGFELNIYEE